MRLVGEQCQRRRISGNVQKIAYPSTAAILHNLENADHATRRDDARLTLLYDLPEFALRHPIPVEDDPPQIERLLLLPGAVVLVEIEHALRHLLEVLDHLQAPGLHATLGDILGRIGVHAADECSERRTPLRARRGMDNVGAERCELAHHLVHVARCDARTP